MPVPRKRPRAANPRRQKDWGMLVEPTRRTSAWGGFMVCSIPAMICSLPQLFQSCYHLTAVLSSFPQNNELLREIFELGPPLVLDAAAIKASKISRFEKVCQQENC